MGKWKFIALIFVIVVAGSLYYYFFIHVHNVRAQEFFKLLDGHAESLESFGGNSLPEDGEVSDLDYYREACSNIEYEEVDISDEKVIYIRKMDCDWDKVNDMLKTIPEDDIVKQNLYLGLSTTNAIRTFMNSFRKKLVDVHYKKGLSFYANSEALTYMMFIAGSSSAHVFSSNMFIRCITEYNNSLSCGPVLSEAKAKASQDLLKEIDLGEDFVSSCARHKIVVLFRPVELDAIIMTRNRADCEYIAGIYRDILEEVKNSDMDVDGKYMIYNTFYVISKNFRGYELRSTDEINEWNYIVIKHLPSEYKDIMPELEET